MTTSTRLNAFLWNRVSQGYARVVQDGPPHARWQAWCRGGPTSRDLSAALYRTPSPTTSRHRNRSLSEEPEEPDPATEREDSEVEVVDVRLEEEEEGGETATAAATASTSIHNAARGNAHAAIRCNATICDFDHNVDCEGGGQAATIDGSMEWAQPLPMSDLSRGARRILFTLEVPENMAVTDLLCTVSNAEDVSDEHRKSKMALRTNLGTYSACRNITQGHSGLTTCRILHQ